MAKTHRIQGDLELLGIAYMGNDQSTGTTRTIQLVGAETNISLVLTPKGTGTIQVPASYEDNISSDQDLINRAYANAKLAGVAAGALVAGPDAAQDGYAITYDHATTSYTLTEIATALAFEDGLSESGGTVKLGGNIDDADTNITQSATGVTRLRTRYTTGSDEAGVAVEAVAQDNNQVTLYAVGGSIKLTPTEAIVTAPGTGALKYVADYSANYTGRTLPDVTFVNGHIGGKSVDANVLAPGAPEHGYVIGWENGSSTYKLIPFPAPSTGYTTVENNGVAVTARTIINFTGVDVSVADSGGKTVVTVNDNNYWKKSGTTIITSDATINVEAGNNFKILGTNDSKLYFSNTLGALVYGTGDLENATTYALVSATSNTAIGIGSVTDGGLTYVLINFDVVNDILTIGDSRAVPKGIQYESDYSAGFTTLSLINKGYALGAKTFTGSQTFRAGTATAGTAPLYLQSGVALTVPQDGALEYHSSHLYFTIGSTRYQLDRQGVNSTDAQKTGNVGTGEDTLIGYLLGSSILITDGDSMLITAHGTFAANNNNKTVKAHLNVSGTPVELFSTGAVAFNDGSWSMQVEIIRTGASEQRCNVIFVATTTGGTPQNVITTKFTQTTHSSVSATLLFKITGEATADDDIVAEVAKLRVEPPGNFQS